VADDQLAAMMYRRQDDQQRAEHPLYLLCVAMREEEAAGDTSNL
jgi:hypothetical protein